MEEVPEHLIIRCITQEATEAEVEKLRQWKTQKKANAKIFDEYVEAWEHAAALAPTFATEGNLQKLNALIDREERHRKKRVILMWRAAAALLIFFSVGLLLFWQSRNVPVQYVERVTAKGQKLTLRLADGTTIKLNANSSLRFPEQFNPNKREVYLEGEAFFDVATDAAKPFIIYSGAVTTQVLGTSFNVRSRAAVTEVAVRTGKVSVSNPVRSTVLLPQQKVTCTDTAWQVEQTSLARELAWTNNEILIDDQPLAQAAATLEEWYGINIRFNSEALKPCRVTGSFRNEPLETVLEAIGLSIDLKYSITDKTVTLTGKGCAR